MYLLTGDRLLPRSSNRLTTRQLDNEMHTQRSLKTTDGIIARRYISNHLWKDIDGQWLTTSSECVGQMVHTSPFVDGVERGQSLGNESVNKSRHHEAYFCTYITDGWSGGAFPRPARAVTCGLPILLVQPGLSEYLVAPTILFRSSVRADSGADGLMPRLNICESVPPHT
jgi:hypothetical protein